MRWSAPSFRGFRMLVCLGLDSLLVDDCIYRQVGGIDEDHFPAAARPQAGASRHSVTGVDADHSFRPK
jgi:hypothetical protein